ncbi:hypothetical Cytosolic protein [Lachnospiraceae bacterium KM106-2]|nr:hypothetical Cytosolic protein [Lachnospiraceae bacterium KM106-2]
MGKLESFEKKIITLDEIQECYGIEKYEELVDLIGQLIKSNQLKAVKGKLNGKSKPLALKYRIISPKKEKVSYERELLITINPRLNIDHYKKHVKQYEKDREMIFRLNSYLSNHAELLDTKISVKERSYEIFGEEKYLDKHGKIVLKNLGLSLTDLNVYKSTEPLVYESQNDSYPQNLLIMENRDTYYSIRRALRMGHKTILGQRIDTVIYGEGKVIYQSLSDIDNCVEQYLKSLDNKIYYFGDLDYEGIGIFEGLAAEYGKKYQFYLLKDAYLKMIEKALKSENPLPKMKEGQAYQAGTEFFKYFTKKEQMQICNILEGGSYIPQEILNISDF